ncbi:MAG: alpha/beta hydrolase [Acidithiobacillus sp.]
MTCRFYPWLLAGITSTLTACSPLQMINKLTPNSTYKVTHGIRYQPGPRGHLDVYVPVPSDGYPKPVGGYPVVMFIYGGAWESGDRQKYKFVGEALAARGLVVVIPNYRLYPAVRYPAFLQDNARAVAWTYHHIETFGGNRHHFYIMGHSAGAYNAAMLALDPLWLKAVGLQPSIFSGWIGLAGPYNFYPITYKPIRPIFFYPDYPPHSQPIDFANRSDAPRTFLGAAVQDNLVNPQTNTEVLAADLKKSGVSVELKMYRGVNHETLIGAFAKPLRWMAPVLEDVVAFIKQGKDASKD